MEPPKHLIGGQDDVFWEPVRTVLAENRAADTFLIGRIARANVRRRQHSAYRKMHPEKKARHARASIPFSAAVGRQSVSPGVIF